MVHPLAAPITASPILNTANSPATKKAAASTATASTTTSSGSSTDSIGSTFLNLLVQELQNQDPTDPMDSTAMVGQMISLNQLDQLVSINQVLGGSTGTLNGASITGGVTSAHSAAKNSTQTTQPFL